uniref:C2H2-type domain-containing protein n=1 Tax=Anopheles dirus TaxID=7168 RepID=A0A182NQC1_9DIPT
MEVPSMVRRSGGKLIVRQVVSGEQRVLDEATKTEVQPEPEPSQLIEGDRLALDNAILPGHVDPNSFTQQQQQLLPQCKIKRNYSCDRCSYFTQNPRFYLTHLRDTHGEKISVNECKRCLYASRHYQKLVRHMRMVHGVSEEPTKVAPLDNRHRKHIKKEFSNQPKHSADSETTIAEPKSLDALTSLYTQQLVASLLPVLLKNIDKSWLPSDFPTIELSDSSVKTEMDGKLNTVSSPDQDTTRGKGKEKNVRASVDDNEPIPKKRARPIPNLIPLASGGASLAARPEKDILKPVPMSVLMPPGANSAPTATGTPNSPPSLSTLGDPHTKCTFCELNFDTTAELANHIAAAHKEDLITSLLQKSIDEANQNIFPQSDTVESASNEMWKSLLEANTDAATRAGGNVHDTGTRPSKDDDDVEIVDNKSETYCGVETAPGYGEVTSTISATDATVAGLMKKVFKCPHCSFWASTASRFHVHIVGHLNKKPFECSLCSYRSNWRWDITKHIRLKTIRDPSHKNAGVLMNDETGRRNYTKYNKYITLMQITDNSTRESTSYVKSFAENNVSDLMSACGTYNIDLKAFANIPGLGFLLEDKQLHDEVTVSNAGSKSDEGYVKCQVCEFRTTSKEELLLHFTSSHTGLVLLEDVIDSETINAPAQSNTPQSKNSTTNMSSTVTPSATIYCSLSTSAANTSSDSSTNGTLLTASGVGEKTNPLESGDKTGESDSNMQRMTMPATWRHNAPYRCGHCHQVSNWKHVIQRHCRLKHNGHVFIEHVNSEKDDPSDSEVQLQRTGKQGHHSVYVIEDVILPLTGAADHLRKSIEALVTSSIPPPLAPFSMQDEVGCPVNTLEPIVEIIDKDPTDMINFNGGLMPSTVLVDSGTVAPAVPSEQLECISCQFRAETAAQLTEHLEQHMSNGPDGGSNSFDSSGLLDPVPTTMYYCARCPARFFHESHVVEHGEKHIAVDGKSCSCCSYTTTDDEERNRHEDVHSAAYNINTENLQIFLAESKEHPKPQLTLRENDGAQLFYVENVAVEQCEPQPSEASSPRKSKKHSKQRIRSPHNSVNGDGDDRLDGQLRSIFLCEYCDQTFDVESELNDHMRTHFSSILSPQDVAYYTSLSSTLNKEKKLELIVSGAQSTMALHYVYDNARKKDWNVYSKSESVVLKF